jgi:sugar lactone lactonase YvrE
MTIWYEVDTNWPQKPANIKWDAVPGVVLDQKGHIWISTRFKPQVQEYDANGRFLRGWGDEIIKTMHYLRFDNEGNIWVADCGRHVMRKFTQSGKLLMTLGTLDEPGEDEKHLNAPTDIAITPTGEMFVSDGYGNTRIVHFDPKGRFIKAWGSRGVGPGQFTLPHSIAIDSAGRLYVADRSNVRVQIFDQNGKFLDQWRNIVLPWGLCVTEKDEIWVCGSSPMQLLKSDASVGAPPKDQLIMKFNPQGKLLQLWAIPKGMDGREKTGELNWVHGIALDSQGNLFLGDIKGKRVQKFVRHKDPRS